MTTRPRTDIRNENPLVDEWMQDVNVFIDEYLGDGTPPTIVANFKVEGESNGVIGYFDALNVPGVTEYAIYRSDTKNFDLSGPTRLIDTKAQPPDPDTDVITFLDPHGSDEKYYFVRAIKGNQYPKLKGQLTGPRNTVEDLRQLVVPGKVTAVSVTVNEIEDAQDVRRASCSFAFTKPDPIGTYEFTEIWIFGYQGGFKPMLAFSGEESGFRGILNITEEKIAFLFVSANPKVRRQVIKATGTYKGSDNVTNKLTDPNGQFKTIGVTTDDLVVNTDNGAMFSITAIDQEGELTLSYISNTPTAGAEGDFDGGDGYMILQGPYDTGILTSANNDTAVPNAASDITLDVDLVSVQALGLLNEVLIGAAATNQNDTAFEVEIHGQPVGQSVFSSSTGFSSPTITKTGPHPLVFSQVISTKSDWEFTARIRNHFGWSDFVTAITYTPSTDPTEAEDDVPSLSSFAVWTLDNPPTPADAKITGNQHRVDIVLGDDNLTTFLVAIEGDASKFATEETVLLDQDQPATCVVDKANKTVEISGYSASANEFDGKLFRFGKDGIKNVGDVLEDVGITSHTTGDPFTITLSSPSPRLANPDGRTMTNWSIREEGIWEIVDFYKELLVDTSGAQQTGAAIFKIPSDYIEATVPSGLYWRARAANVWGRGAYVYADATVSGTVSKASAILKTTSGVTASQVRKGIVPAVVNLTFTPDATNPHRRASWGAGTIAYADGTTESINAGNTGLLSTGTVYYVYKIESNATLQFTTTFSNAIGNDRTFLGQLITDTSANETLTVYLFGTAGGPILTAAVAAIGKLSALSADIGTITAGSLTAVTITASVFQTASSGGPRIVISLADQIDFYDSSGSKIANIDAFTGGAGILWIAPATDGTRTLSLGDIATRWDVAQMHSTSQVQLQSGGVVIELSGDDTDIRIDGGPVLIGIATQDVGASENLICGGALIAVSAESNASAGLMNVSGGRVNIQSTRTGSGTTLPLSFWVGNTPTLYLEIETGGDIVPGSDDAQSLGTASKRWSDLRSVLINGADIGFASGWKFREWPAKDEDIGKPESWFKKNANQGIQLIDHMGRVVAVFHLDGHIYSNGIRDLKDLPMAS